MAASIYAPSLHHIDSISKTLNDKIHLGSDHRATAAAEIQHQYTASPAAGAHVELEAASAELHVVMVPYPLQGHINPMVQFAESLIAKHADVHVTFINNKHNHDRMIHSALTSAALVTPSTSSNAVPASKVVKVTSDTHTQDHIDSKQLELVWLDDGLPPDFDYMDLSLDRLKQLRVATSAMKEPFKQLLQSLNQKSPRVSCVLFGSFCPWVHYVAAELGIPSVFFWTQSTSVFSMYYHAPLLAAHGFFPYDKNSLPDAAARCREGVDRELHKGSDYVQVSYIPGVPPLAPSSFPTLLHIDNLSNPSFASIRNQFSILRECKGVIINSFEELEKEASDAVRRELPFPVYLVGPLIPPAFLDQRDNITETSADTSSLQLQLEKHECIQWLDCQEKHSVLFVSFGTICHPSDEDVECIACGIKSSKQPFLWVIRPRPSLQHVTDVLPKNFIEDTQDYGLIIPWAPQMQVLSHPSIGAFLTHCGWNSTLESLSMGVPMIPFPIFSDQPTNCTYVCDVWKVGMAVKRQAATGTVKSESVEVVLRTVLHEEEGKKMRERARRLKEAARQAVLTRGPSSDDREDFVQHMKIQCLQPTARIYNEKHNLK